MKKIPLNEENRDKQKNIRKKVAEGDSLEPLMNKKAKNALSLFGGMMGVAVSPVLLGKLRSDRSEKIHVVQDGDTLSSIARKYGTTVAKLKKLNNLTDEQAVQLKTGQKIRYK